MNEEKEKGAIVPATPTGAETTTETTTENRNMTAASATEEGVTMRFGDDPVEEATAEDRAGAEKIAEARPDGEARAIVAIEGDDRYVTREEAEEMARKAYLEGRNEAVHAQMLEDTTIEQAQTPETQPMAELLAVIRRSVWEC